MRVPTNAGLARVRSKAWVSQLQTIRLDQVKGSTQNPHNILTPTKKRGLGRLVLGILKVSCLRLHLSSWRAQVIYAHLFRTSELTFNNLLRFQLNDWKDTPCFRNTGVLVSPFLLVAKKIYRPSGPVDFSTLCLHPNEAILMTVVVSGKGLISNCYSI